MNSLGRIVLAVVLILAIAFFAGAAGNFVGDLIGGSAGQTASWVTALVLALVLAYGWWRWGRARPAS